MSLTKNTAWNFIGSVAPMLLGLVTIPYLIDQIGVEAFGILTLVWSLIGYFSIFDFGIGRALTHQVSSNIAKNLWDGLPNIIKTGLFFMLLTGFLGGLILAGLANQLGSHWLNVTANLEDDTFKCLLIAAIGIPLTTISTGLKGILEGFEDFQAANILRIILGVSNFGLPALTVMFVDKSLQALVVGLVVTRLIVLIAHVIVINRRLSIKTIFGASLATKAETKSILTFGAWMTLSNIISPLMVTADRFIISYMMGASLVAFYTVPFDFIVRLLVIPAALTGVLFPRFSYLFRNSFGEVRPLYRKSIYLILGAMGFVSLSLVIGSYFGLSLWLGAEFAEKSWLIASILSIGLLFNSLAQVPHAAVQAAGDVKVTSIIHLLEFVVYVPLLYISLHFYDLIGAAAVWVIRVFADFVVLSIFARKKMRNNIYG